ncbi:MAG: DUF2207 domain-containing protein [Propionibacteriaceae bacterium]|nr:DUF2207 domain-containing protein [Propionibacteriaceae bacterium]
MKRACRILLVTMGAILFGLSTALPAQGAEENLVEIEAELTDQGFLEVTTTIFLAEPLGEQELTFDIPKRIDRGSMRYTYLIDFPGDLDDGSPGSAMINDAEETADNWRLVLNDPTATEVTFLYTVEGTTIANIDGSVFFTWPLIQGMNIDVARVSARVNIPPGFENSDCRAGIPGALQNCSTRGSGTHQTGYGVLEITNSPTKAGEIVQTELTYPEGTVAVTEQATTMWTLGRAMTPGFKQLGLTAILLVVGGLVLYLLARVVHGRSHRGKPALVARFAKNSAGHTVFTTEPSARVGMIGTLVDSSVDPIDVLASILDLAIRGHLRITELETSRYSPPDWSFTRLEGADSLKDYEVQLLNALCAHGNPEQDKVSEMSATIGPAIDSVQASLYQEMLDSRWFSRLPWQKSRLVPVSWIMLALALVAAGVLLAFTTFGLVGLALVALACMFWAISQLAQPITSTGARVLAGLKPLGDQLKMYPPDEIDPTDLCDQVSLVLPYSLVLGGSERWLDIMVNADESQEPDSDVLSWFHAPSDWHLKYFPASLESFITTVIGRLYTRI